MKLQHLFVNMRHIYANYTNNVMHNKNNNYYY